MASSVRVLIVCAVEHKAHPLPTSPIQEIYSISDPLLYPRINLIRNIVVGILVPSYIKHHRQYLVGGIRGKILTSTTLFHNHRNLGPLSDKFWLLYDIHIQPLTNMPSLETTHQRLQSVQKMNNHSQYDNEKAKHPDYQTPTASRDILHAKSANTAEKGQHSYSPSGFKLAVSLLIGLLGRTAGCVTIS
jgi:hypothetical protein